MQLARISKTSDYYGRYYTHQLVASLLVDAVSDHSPDLVIDLGCGEGALIVEAKRQWSKSTCVSADIDRSAKPESEANGVGGIRHHTVDVLERSIDSKIGVGFGTVDLALCNPPYVRPKWRKHFGEMLEEAGLSHIIPKMGCVPAEVLFIAQNLRFLRSKGKLGLILPDGVVSGEKFRELRTVLTTSHRLEQVIELPRGIFRKTDAKAHILIIAKDEAPREDVKVQRLEESGRLSSAVFLPPEEAAKRADYSHVSISRSAPANGLSIGSFAMFSRRGSYSSAEKRNSSLPIFHTTDFGSSFDRVPSEFILTKAVVKDVPGVVAEPGDILVARVGRNLSEKICIVPRGRVIISDSVIALRVNQECRDRIFLFLKSPRGRRALDSAAHGVGARFITIEGLLAIPLP